MQLLAVLPLFLKPIGIWFNLEISRLLYERILACSKRDFLQQFFLSQKQLLADVLQNRRSKTFPNIRKKTPVLEPSAPDSFSEHTRSTVENSTE